jgi:ferric-dicitrate binding protein FerR (iron transport regulator)
MQDPRTYRQYADECMKLARAMPQHRDALVDMAATWQRLADAAENEAKKNRA